MLGSGLTVQSLLDGLTAAQVSDTQVDVFNELYLVFLITGTVVGVVVIAYLLYNAYKYRTAGPEGEGQYDIDVESLDAAEGDEKVIRPELGVLPSQADTASGKKLFLSFAISAAIVLALIIFAYWNLLLVEGMAAEPEDNDALVVEVDSHQFAFDYIYPTGERSGDLVVPEGRLIVLNVTATDVMHTWGSPEFRAKTDGIPGDFTTTWFVGTEVGEYSVICYELCGAGHTDMRNDDEIRVLPEDEFADWCVDNECMEEEELDDWLERTRGEN